MKRLLCSVLAILLAAAQAAAQARTVAVVFDDSGSMDDQLLPNGPWRDANYALQILAGLLSPRDALTVVRMSQPSTATRIPLDDQAAAIAAIRATPHPGGGTEYEAVHTAMHVLEDAQDAEARAGRPATEKWLIIITDGQFFNGTPSSADLRALADEAGDFVGRTGAQTVLLMIGQVQSDIAAPWEQAGQARVYGAGSRQDIAGQMRRIAVDITARSEHPLRVRFSGATASFTSEFPLRRVTVFQQDAAGGAMAGLRAATGTGGPLSAGAALEPGFPPGSASGTAARIQHVAGSGAGALVPAGPVTLTFDRAADARRLQVLPEVDASLDAWLADARGRRLHGSGSAFEVCAGDTVRLRATLVSPAGDTLLRRARNPGQFRVEARYGANPRRMPPAAGGGYFESATVAAPGTVSISVSASYPGYFHFRSRIFALRAVQCRPRTLGFLPVRPWRARVTELGSAPPIEIVPTADGARVTPGELRRWTLTRVDGGPLPVKIERTPRGWRLRPHRRWGLACCTPTGTHLLQFEARSGVPREPPRPLSVRVRVDPAPFWEACGWLVVTGVIALLGGIYAWLLVRKRRFCRGGEIVFQRIRQGVARRPETHRLADGRWWVRWLVPTAAERSRGMEVTFEAGSRCGHVRIPTHVQSEQMYVDGEKVEDPGRRALTLAQGARLEIRRGGGSKDVYTYHDLR